MLAHDASLGDIITEESLLGGSVIEVQEKSRFRLAVVLRDEGKRGYRILDEAGREASIQFKQVVWRLDQLNPHFGSAQLAAELGSLRSRAAAKTRQADVAALWELIVDDGAEPLSPTLASDLLFGDTSPVSKLASVLALREDDTYFRARGLSFEPRKAEHIEELQRQRAVEGEKSRGRGAFIERIATLLAHDDDNTRREALAEARQEDVFTRYLALMVDYAVAGDDFAGAADAENLLDDIEASGKRRIAGHHSERAFALLVAVGHWDKDHNLFLARFRVPGEFSDELEALAAELLHSAKQVLARGVDESREDWTSRRTVTIDDPETRDIDDGLSLHRRPSGDGWVLGVHIAAPSTWLTFDSELEREARRRGSSAYVPERRVPMFPACLSDDLFSLVQGELRPALTFVVELDEFHTVLSTRVARTWVRVDERLDYQQADRLMEYEEGPTATMLRELHVLADTHFGMRNAGGAVALDLPQLKIRVDATGRVDVTLLADCLSRGMVSELAVLANSIAGQICADNHITAFFRGQDSPRGPIEGPEFDELPDGIPRAMAMRRRMSGAATSLIPVSHFGLGVSAYVQTSSPIRRYHDLAAHFQLEGWLQRGRGALDDEQLAGVRLVVDRAVGQVQRAERASNRYWLLRHIEENKHLPLEGVVIAYDDPRGDRASLVLLETMLQVRVSTRTRLPIGTAVSLEIDRVSARSNVLAVRIAH